eukprot:scaffold310584_cov28-Tisochrysis_lutea.AAC.3
MCTAFCQSRSNTRGRRIAEDDGELLPQLPSFLVRKQARLHVLHSTRVRRVTGNRRGRLDSDVHEIFAVHISVTYVKELSLSEPSLFHRQAPELRIMPLFRDEGMQHAKANAIE